MDKQTEVIIVGGGMVGATLACLLGSAGRDVVVLDAGEPPTMPDTANMPPDLRVSSVNRATAAVFEQAGAWHAMQRHHPSPFRRVSVWDGTGGGTTFSAREAGCDCLGWFIENRVIRFAVYEAAMRLGRVDWRSGVQPQAVTTGPARATVTLGDGTHLVAGLVVGADGPNSSVRAEAGITAHVEDYQQRALVTNVGTSLPHQDITWQRFTPEGPQAFLPLAGPHASLVWYGAPDAVRAREALADAELATALQAAFPDELGGIETIHGRASFRIIRQHAARYTAPRIALVGDAAHVIHPLMGQGLNLGIDGARTLAEVLRAGTGCDIGSLPILAGYERRHRPRALALMAATNTCHHLFTREDGFLRRVGDSLLGLARHAPVGRREVIRFAMGWPLAQR